MFSPVRFRMLVADADAATQAALRELFALDFEITEAGDAGEAKARMEGAEGFDCALVATELAGGEGLELCRWVRAHPRLSRTPVLLLSRDAREASEARGLDAGAVDYLLKPLRPAILRARVAAHVALKRQVDHLAAQALTDPLTGLANRRHFLAAVGREWRRGLRHATPLGLILADIDDFKRFNDRYGHPAGDECLVRVARALEGAARRSADFVGRLGGEEFALLLADSDAAGIERVADRVCRRIAALAIPHADSRAGACVTVSVGWVAAVPTAESAARDLIDAADRELYAAKLAGRARSRGRIVPSAAIAPVAFGHVPSFGGGLACVGI